MIQQPKQPSYEPSTSNLDMLIDATKLSREPKFVPIIDTIKFARKVINEILYDIITNTLASASLKVNLHQWQGKGELYDLGIIYKEQYKVEIQRMQEQWLAQHLKEENMWKLKLENVKQLKIK
jgi:hypothetical protein